MKKMIQSGRQPWGALGAMALASCSHQPDPRQNRVIQSPDHSIAIAAAVRPDGHLHVAVGRHGRMLIKRSLAAVDLADKPLGPLVEVRRDTAMITPGSSARPCGAGTLVARERDAPHRLIRLETRACDAGAAFRLVIPQQAAIATLRITGESTRLNLPLRAQCLAVGHKRVFNSHEGDYAPTPAAALKANLVYDLPLTCLSGQGGEAFAITESGIENYPAAYLSGTSTPAQVSIRLAPRPENDRFAAVYPRIPAVGVATPWRVIMIADRAEKLPESHLVQDLAAPSRIGDASWVIPGKAAWGWWSGLLAPDVPDAGHNMATYRRYIDFAARFGLPYYVIDEGWAPKVGDTPADVMRGAPGIDIPELVRYARARNVRIWLWTDWKSLDGRMDTVLDRWSEWGVAGIKADFIYRQDQAVVGFYHAVLTSAAKRHLLVDLHASFVPRGLERTYPNFLTSEGAMGNEYNRWSSKVTAGYNVRAAYSRATIGPMDYTPGGFRNVTPQAFSARKPPVVMTTRSHQLALFVLYPSPLTMLADAPSAYRSPNGGWAPGGEFLRAVPTTWDETRGIAGAFGKWIAVARRRGNVWYVGAITDEHARDVALPLDFLGGGRWKVRAWIDGAGPPTTVDRREGAVRGGRLLLRLAGNGGAAFQFRR